MNIDDENYNPQNWYVPGAIWKARRKIKALYRKESFEIKRGDTVMLINYVCQFGVESALILFDNKELLLMNFDSALDFNFLT